MSDPLIKGGTYVLNRYGHSEYCGLDVFNGETTLKFSNGGGTFYIKPEALPSLLSQGAGEAQRQDGLIDKAILNELNRQFDVGVRSVTSVNVNDLTKAVCAALASQAPSEASSGVKFTGTCPKCKAFVTKGKYHATTCSYASPPPSASQASCTPPVNADMVDRALNAWFKSPPSETDMGLERSMKAALEAALSREEGSAA